MSFEEAMQQATSVEQRAAPVTRGDVPAIEDYEPFFTSMEETRRTGLVQSFNDRLEEFLGQLADNFPQLAQLIEERVMIIAGLLQSKGPAYILEQFYSLSSEAHTLFQNKEMAWTAKVDVLLKDYSAIAAQSLGVNLGAIWVSSDDVTKGAIAGTFQFLWSCADFYAVGVVKEVVDMRQSFVVAIQKAHALFDAAEAEGRCVTHGEVMDVMGARLGQAQQAAIQEAA